jgi:undecaprenyl diphosphate synthase
MQNQKKFLQYRKLFERGGRLSVPFLQFMEDNMAVPNHIAIILDGNGRWAKSKGMPRQYGHMQGTKNVEIILSEAYDLGVKYVTMYAFSTENWNRPNEEVEELLNIFRGYLKSCLKTAKKNNMRVEVIGDKTRFDSDIQSKIIDLEKKTAQYTGLCFVVALNYGSRDEIKRAVRSIAMEVQNKEIDPMLIDEKTIEDHLDTKDIPDPDLCIRTSGELRLSNFLLWQLAYAELYYTDVHWPDFTVEEFHKAISSYENRKRRFGGVKEKK